MSEKLTVDIDMQVWAKVSHSVQHKSSLSTHLVTDFNDPLCVCGIPGMPEYEIESKVGNSNVFQIVTKWVTRICDPSKTYDHIYLRWVTFKRYFMMFRKQVKAGSMSNSKEKSMASIRQNIFHTLNDSIVITLSDRFTRK